MHRESSLDAITAIPPRLIEFTACVNNAVDRVTIPSAQHAKG